jgi:hypothetical protein
MVGIETEFSDQLWLESSLGDIEQKKQFLCRPLFISVIKIDAEYLNTHTRTN